MTHPRPFDPTGGSAFLEAASRIGARLVHDALWHAGACTWTVMSPDRSHPGRRAVVPAPAGAAVYQGTAGIGLFLAELAALTGDAEPARAAEGAVRHAAAGGEELPDTAFGLHSGRVGIAYAALRLAELLGREELREGASRLLAPLEGKESLDRATDVIGGAAGAVPALLRMADTLDRERLTGIARRLGDHLASTALREPEGWSWATMPAASARSLNGYAHGAAGCGHALLELYHATGEGRFRYGAEQAFAYERRTFCPELGNWPDLRHTELSEYVQHGRREELRALLLSEEGLPAYAPHFMSAWCHGAPGIGLTRLRAWRLLGGGVFREEALAAVRATRESLREGRMNYSLCHGRAGNAETLLLASEVLGDASLRAEAERCMREGCEVYEAAGKPWSCGTLGGVYDPSLLLGEAGIGHFLLRLHSPSVPSILLVTARGEGAAAPARDDGYREAAAADVEAYFGRTLRLFGALGEDVDAQVESAVRESLPRRSPVVAVHEGLEERVAAPRAGGAGALLADASAPDRARVELSRSVEDYTAEYLDGVLRESVPEVPWGEVEVALSERVRVVHSAWDWDGWLAAGGAAAGPEPSDVFFLLHASGGRVTVRPLSPFAAVVLESVCSPASVGEVVARVEEAVAGDRAPDRRWLEPRVLEQLREAYRAGLVTCTPAPAAVAAPA